MLNRLLITSRSSSSLVTRAASLSCLTRVSTFSAQHTRSVIARQRQHQFFSSSSIDEIIPSQPGDELKPLPEVKKTIQSLIDEELHELEGEKHDNVVNSYFSDKQFKLKRDEEYVELERTEPIHGYNVSIIFDTTFEVEDEEVGGFEDEIEDDEEEDNDLDDLDDFESEANQGVYTYPRPFAMHLRKPDQGAQGIFVKCVAGDDGRLYVESIASDVQLEQVPDMLSLSKYGAAADGVRFEELAGELQNQVYDLLDHLQLDDRLAQSVQQYVEVLKAKEDMSHLRGLKEFLD